eukprot:s833_g10.t1
MRKTVQWYCQGCFDENADYEGVVFVVRRRSKNEAQRKWVAASNGKMKLEGYFNCQFTDHISTQNGDEHVGVANVPKKWIWNVPDDSSQMSMGIIRMPQNESMMWRPHGTPLLCLAEMAEWNRLATVRPWEISVEDEGPDEPAYDLEPSVLGTPPDLSFMSLGGLLQNACQFVFPKQCDDPEGWARRFRVSSAGAVHIFRWKIDCCHSHRKIQSFGASRLTSISLSPQIEEVPSRSSSSLIIHHRLGSESHYQAVLKLVEEYLPKFDIYNCATALHKFGLNSRDDELATRQIQSDPNFIRLFSATKKRALEIETVAKARLNIYDSELTKAVAEDAQSRMNQYSPQQIGMIMWALGYSGVRPRPSFIKAMITELQGRPDFDSHTCMMITYSCMRLGIRDKRVMEAVGRVIIDSNLEDAEPLEVASYCYAYGKLEYWEKGAFSVIADRVLDTMGDFSPRMFSMSALGLAAAAAVLEGFDETMDKLTLVE